jgi:DNA-binding LacI/PurR family transcriptional regulator
MAVSQAIPLTSVSLPAAAVGELAVEMLMKQLGGNTAGEVRLLSPVLTDRGSTARP